MKGNIRQTFGLVIHASHLLRHMKDRMLPAKSNRLFYKLEHFLILFYAFPVDPSYLIILTIGIIVSVLGITELISTVDHRNALTKQYHKKCISQLTFSQLTDLHLPARADLNIQYNQAQSTYNQTDTAYQIAFATWQADSSDENLQALNEAESSRTQAQLAMQQAKQDYDDCRSQTPQMPTLADFTGSDSAYSGGFSDGSDGTDTDDEEDDSSEDYDYSGSDTSTATADTSALESAMEKASDELAELQSDLASEKAIADADPTSLTKEEKEKLKVTDNLSELDAKSAKELVEEGKKGITAEFNGIISKADIKEGAAVSQGMELFTIQNTDKASVDVTLSKYDYDTVKEGQTADITMGDQTYQGTVTNMSHIAVQNEKGTPVISATVSIDNPNDDIFLGVDAKVKIHAASAKNVVTLPVEVVNIGKDGSFCYVIEDGLVTKRNITTGISSEDYIEIKEGIKEGEEVISDLGDYTEGMQVQAVSEQSGEDANE